MEKHLHQIQVSPLGEIPILDIECTSEGGSAWLLHTSKRAKYSISLKVHWIATMEESFSPPNPL